jgi:uncharacterized membrane protein
MHQENIKDPKPRLKLVYAIVIFLTLIGIGIVARRTMKLAPVLINGFQPHVSQANKRLEELAATDDIFARYPILTLVHILPGLVYLLTAPFQFSKKIRQRNITTHRRLGRVVIISGLTAGITAFIMSLAMPSIGGVNQAAATLLFSIFFLFALSKAYLLIRKGKIVFHREWMIRAYAIGLAITTIRPIVGIFFATSGFTGLTPYEFFGTAFWIGFVLHLVAAEVWIYRTRPGQRYLL